MSVSSMSVSPKSRLSGSVFSKTVSSGIVASAGREIFEKGAQSLDAVLGGSIFGIVATKKHDGVIAVVDKGSDRTA